MRIAAYQCASPAGDIPAGLFVVESALAGAAEAGVQMLVLPELFLPGYNSTPATPPDGWDDVMPALRDLCVRHRVALTIGLPDYDGGAVFNAAFAIGADGSPLARYRKVQLFGDGEKALFTPGDRLVAFDYGGTRFGLLICYDVEFPEHVRALARDGVSALLVPTANPMPFVNVSLVQVPGRALENAITIAYANFTGAEGGLSYTGYSVISGPDGYPLATRGRGAGLLVADLPAGLLENNVPLSTQLADYRAAKPPC